MESTSQALETSRTSDTAKGSIMPSTFPSRMGLMMSRTRASLNRSACVCVCVCTYVYAYVCRYVCVYTYVCIYTYVHTHSCWCVHVLMYVHLPVKICVYVRECTPTVNPSNPALNCRNLSYVDTCHWNLMTLHGLPWYIFNP